MTGITAPASFVFSQAFLKLDAPTRLWIQTKAQMYVSLGRFGPTEINLFRQQLIARFGAAATTGSPSLLEVAIWYILGKLVASSAGTILQNSLQQQQQILQTLSNVSKLLHDTAQTTISNLK
jgi:hypothetical protein